MFSFRGWLKCLQDGHKWRNSHAKRGYWTCERCRLRKRG
jgi:hypothetical protein